jgi:hypothetical protein
MAQLTLDGNNYDWMHGSYEVDLPRLHESRPTASGSHARTDNGPWKKQFKFTIVCDNNGVTNGAKTVRNNLRVSHAKNVPVTFVTPDADTYSCYFYASLSEKYRFDVDVTNLGYEYLVDVVLIQA